jgi:dinuclear metal center YbgI/SA1388 family protein
MIHAEIIRVLERWAPPALQEDYDNCGLLVGTGSDETSGVLVCLDVTEAILAEAIRKGCNLIVAHHPLIFKGIKRLTGSGYVERTAIMALRNGISIYAIHTNLDNVRTGVNNEICRRIGLIDTRILRPMPRRLLKVAVHVPLASHDAVSSAMFAAGAGHIGNYSECSFSVSGSGTFQPQDGSNPFAGTIGVREQVEEQRIEVIVPDTHMAPVLAAMKAAHPYEEVAYDVIRLENVWQDAGAGMVGELPESMTPEDFLQHLKAVFRSECLRYTPAAGSAVKRVAVCGGSGSFLLRDAIGAGADVFVTGDFKYHEFFDADGRIMIADVGHYESEQYTIDLLAEQLSVNFPNFAIRKAETNTNPFKSIK